MKRDPLDNHDQVGIAGLLNAYQRQFGFNAVFVDMRGIIMAGRMGCAECNVAECQGLRRRIVAESLRWGSPFTDLCPRGHMIWGVPVMTNQRMVGGLIAAAAAHDEQRMSAIRASADGLLALAGEYNITNIAWLAEHRIAAEKERHKAEAIHDAKGVDYDYIRTVYLQEEPSLIAAIRKGERGDARAIINRILVGIYFIGRERLDLLKSLVMELVVMMSRAAVEAGADPAAMLGGHYRGLTELSTIHDDEALTHWLAGMLERVMDAIHDNRRYPNAILLSRALRYMQDNLAENLSRDQVAQAAGLSPSHFSHLMKAQLGSSFTKLLVQYRVDRAAQQLAHTMESIAEIALNCGFPDQSYFTKVFRKQTGKTPLAYRKERL